MVEDSFVKLVECPRDAMQGWKQMIPTEKKLEYLHALLRVGFDTIDFGSFVSPAAIPQMSDTANVIGELDTSGTRSKLLAIVANLRGAEQACASPLISYLGFPFSVSETFQKKNTNSTIQDSLQRVRGIRELCNRHGKELVVYISMGFGNPYGDPYSAEIVYEWIDRIAGLGVNTVSLADTVGLAEPAQIFTMTKFAVEHLPGIEIGVHLHSRPEGWREKIIAASEAGCRRFDGAMRGVGGCPMANDELVGNMATENLIAFFAEKNMLAPLDKEALALSARLAAEIFA
jgi:hydroxymethylglutaryl-CoA lyase